MIKHVVLSLILTTQLGFGQALLESVLPQVDSFQEGEWFQLRLHYGPINASYATFSLERDTLEGKPVFHAKGFGETTGFARLFFKVEDYYESYFDEKTIQPYKFIRNINEGGYTKNVEIDFDQKNGTATVNDKKKAQINKFPTTEGVQDLISCFYFLRNFYPKDEIEINESFDINMFFDNENYVFKLKYLGKETVNSKFGKIECMKFRPLVQSGRVFEEQESVTLWVSDDDNRLPIRLQADILVGSIKADLENFKNLKHPFKIVVK
ncbi:DUF3108 domain-containing protein [Flavobacteriaceae bacterium]|jgi:hypothetical protein|nr:DUF3108 domain-containing protein [Flavobacteriaceae bacterium]MDA9037542.1 DUF3108 domain-containing protein [Flavobacteriaceae bacterium]